MLAQASALAAATTILLGQGTSTGVADGSQLMPREYWNAIAAASTAWQTPAPASAMRAAAVMPEATPHSAWQPHTSAAKVVWKATRTPIRPPANIARTAASSPPPRASAAARQVPGRAAQAPPVGAAT